MLYMRHILAATVCCALVVAIAACGTDADGATPAAGVEAGPASPSSTFATPTAEVEADEGTSESSVIYSPAPYDESESSSADPDDDEGETEVYQTHAHRSPASFASASLDEQIYYSDVIARATLKSATSTAETVLGEGGSAATYRPVQELRFTVHEYLKGRGQSEVLVVVRGDRTYATAATAREEVDFAMLFRNTTWDNRQGVLFLRTLDGSSRFVARYTSANATGAATTSAFAMYTGSTYEEWWDYTVDGLSRGWLPAGDAAASGSSDGVSGAASVSFIEDGSETPYSTVTLGKLKTKIAEMAATLKAGEGIAGYEECMKIRFRRERIRRINPWTPLQYKATLASGSATGTEVFRERKTTPEPKYLHYYVTGADKDYFQAPIVDEDSDPYNGYFRTLSTTRPLPAGTYSVKFNLQHYKHFPCNFKPDDAYDQWTVTVTAPSGTVHEAFFDPASTFLGVGASGGAGVISPASFNVGGATATITRIVVSFGSMVSMQISPSVSLSGKHIEFIKVDGTVAARLSFDKGDLKGGIGIGGASAGNGTSTAEAAVSAAAHAEIAAAMAEAQATGSKMYFWFVSSAPWKAGDKLMLRIR